MSKRPYFTAFFVVFEIFDGLADKVHISVSGSRFSRALAEWQITRVARSSP